ncbi:unnamed protein product [Caenorhabditis nigoni]
MPIWVPPKVYINPLYLRDSTDERLHPFRRREQPTRACTLKKAEAPTQIPKKAPAKITKKAPPKKAVTPKKTATSKKAPAKVTKKVPTAKKSKAKKAPAKKTTTKKV